ncbi:cell division topological specificity factor MinE [Clostridium peptidivorans]|uniref:cell division topological specificity factor MinE n=1 Tax=Clostridium peptidivorans TaxID=100174 RepID=UPI000BE40978|nr:cell division topological specificity factor MinE [Clostridium peptidivorans]
MDFFSFFTPKPASKNVAKERLKLILIHDRADFSPELLENIREDIMKVISKYVEIDREDMEIKMTSSDEEQSSSPALIASIPIKSMKRR